MPTMMEPMTSKSWRILRRQISTECRTSAISPSPSLVPPSLKFKAPVDYWCEYKDGILTLHFTLPLEQPVAAGADASFVRDLRPVVLHRLQFGQNRSDQARGGRSRRVHDNNDATGKGRGRNPAPRRDFSSRRTDVRSQCGSDRVGPMRKILTGMFLLRETSSVALAHGRLLTSPR